MSVTWRQEQRKVLDPEIISWHKLKISKVQEQLFHTTLGVCLEWNAFIAPYHGTLGFCVRQIEKAIEQSWKNCNETWDRCKRLKIRPHHPKVKRYLLLGERVGMITVCDLIDQVLKIRWLVWPDHYVIDFIFHSSSLPKEFCFCNGSLFEDENFAFC